MDLEYQSKIEELEKKLDEIYISVEKTRKMIFWTGIITAVVIILPLIIMAFVLPSFISNYTETLDILGEI